MMYDLDFSALTDDQLVNLIRCATAAAMTRGDVCVEQARAAYLSGCERVLVMQAATAEEAERIHREEVQRAAEEAAEKLRAQVERQREGEATAKEARLWGLKKGCAEAVKALFGACGFPMKEMSVNVWKKGAERRIYIGYGFDKDVIAYYVTGNGRHPPGTLINSHKDKDIKAHAQEIRALCVALEAMWSEAKFDVLAALGWSGEAIPMKGYTVAMPALPAAAPAPVTLPSSLELREGIGGVRCTDCKQWAREGESIRHTRFCETSAQVPAGYVWPVEAPAGVEAAAP